jgi:hypothetical protein
LKPSLAFRLALLFHLIAAPLCALGAGVLAAGSLVASGGTAELTHTWVVLPVDEVGRCTVLHIPPRHGSHRARAPKPGEARIANVLATTPVAAAARGSRLALVFPDSRDGGPNRHGRVVLSLGATLAGQGEWRVIPEKRLDPLPSLRADGLLLGFAGSPVGYAALFQGLASDTPDPSRLVLYVLVNDRWTEVVLPPELQAVGAETFQRQDDRPATLATWRLFATDTGLGVTVIPKRDASEPIRGAIFLADFSGSAKGAAPSATWTRRDLLLEAHGSVPSDQIGAVGAAGHVVLTTRDGDGTLRIFTQTAAAPGIWREIAAVSNISPDHAVAAMESLRSITVVSAPPRGTSRDPLPCRIVEVSVGTGAVLHDGPLVIRSPVGVSDYRLIGLLLAYAVGLVLVFVIRAPARESVHLPQGVSMAEPGRRMIASVIDLLVGVLVACRLLGVPVSEFLGSGLFSSGPSQSVALTALGLLIVANTVLETLMGRSLGKMIAGCAVIMMQSGPAPASGGDQQIKTPSLWRSFVRNLIKWGLPPVALLGLLDPGARHRADLLAGTGVVIETGEDEPEVPDEG